MIAASEAGDDIDVQSRVLQILAALEEAGATPIANRDLHAIAYLANVLSPMWDIEPIEGSILKTRDGPHSSLFERQLDRCVCQGLVVVTSLEDDPESSSRIAATYRLAGDVARPILAVINDFPDEQIVRGFLNELAFAFASIEPEMRDNTALADASWTHPAVADQRVVDFAEFADQSRNPSRNVVNAFQRYAPAGVIYSRAEKLAMYVQLLRRRANA
ncbi:hypothetical protein SAMN05518668_1025 [Sphingobium sp. YR657]|uniref:hypothetical protein n=1 Tax=Sphingobium sp. YR657 TaxID=1884366 RepID=UPI00091BD0D1|nr:hypothetical protein [Sphingobium sp. YR657]SHL59677.1 hypothetical protein SAMN05518668_1025 [Sphingobium sp. YR657]